VTANVDSIKEDPQVIIFNLRQVLKNVTNFGIETHHLFIDFRTAYDSIDRSDLYIAMEKFQIPRKLIALVKAIMSNTLCQIRIQNLLSDPIHIKKWCQARRCPGLPTV
jgi:hypothetical protein